MTNDVKYTVTTYDGKKATFILRNTLRHDIRFRVLAKRFAGDDLADATERWNFVFFMARVVEVKGIDWEPVEDQCKPAEFEASYLGFADLFDAAAMENCAQAVIAMKTPRTDAVEKPDALLTEEEKADPNS